jgi:hypothetical protein
MATLRGAQRGQSGLKRRTKPASRLRAFLLPFLVIAGCAEAPPKIEAATIGANGGEAAMPYPEAESAWGKLHSLRFHLQIPVPDPTGWKIDDRSRAELAASQASTKSRLVVSLETEPSLMNRQRCEARARELGLVPDALRTVEDTVTIGPEAYDTRVLVAIEAPKSAKNAENEPITGHVFAFGAYVRRCLFVHLATEIPAGRDESILSQRLALARVRLVGGITMDNFQEVPREKEEPGRR